MLVKNKNKKILNNYVSMLVSKYDY